MLELHVWGPAFSLPSIDARCLAAIAFFTRAVPKTEWTAVACCDVSQSPTNELPALKDGDKWIGGFESIVDYIYDVSDGRWSLEDSLTEKQRADAIAYRSYLDTHAQPLLDLSLYVSSDNFINITRPLYSRILPFPLAYTIPPALRTAAKERTEHLGLSSLDIDSEERSEDANQSIIPESLRRSKATVSSLLLQTPEGAARIRLEALSTDFFLPLAQLKGKKRFLVSHDTVTTLDCLAFGYLALMLLPDLPQSWLASSMRSTFPQLCEYVVRLKSICVSGDVQLEDAFSALSLEGSRDMSDQSLSWKQTDQRGVLTIGGVFGSTLLEHVPFLGRQRRLARARVDSEAQQTVDVPFWKRRGIAMTVGSSTLGLVALVGCALWQGLLPMPSAARTRTAKNKKGLEDYGEAGEALSIFANQLDIATQSTRA